MHRLALRDLFAHRRRFAGTFAAVVLGVAFVSGTLVLGDTMSANFDHLFRDAHAGTDVVVRQPAQVPAGDLGAGRSLLPAGTLEQVAASTGVAAAAGRVEGYGQLIGRNGSPVGGDGPPTFAGNWISDAGLNPYRLAEGRAPEQPGEVVVNRGAARAAGIGVGDQVTVRTPDPVKATVVGVATFGTADGLGATTFTAFTLEEAQRLLTPGPGLLSSVVARAEPGIEPPALAARLRQALGPGVEVLTGAELAGEQLDALSADFLGMFRRVLLVFAGVALLVAAFSIHNTFSIVAAQRTREAALLRALGASRRQVLTAALSETAVVALVATAAGVAAGLGVAGLLKGMFDAFGFSLPAGGLAVEPPRLLAAAAVGATATLVSGVGPAVRSSRTAPLAAVRDGSVERPVPSARALAGLATTVLGLSALLMAADRGRAGLAGLGGATVLAGLVLAGPSAAGPGALVLGAIPARLRGVPAVLARRNAAGSPRRTSGAAAALLVGVAVVTLFTVFASSVRASVAERVTGAVVADLVVGGGRFGFGGLSPRLAGDLAALDEVAAAVGVGAGTALVDGRAGEVSMADPAPLARLLDLGVEAGAVGRLGPADLAVSSPLAASRGWAVGSRVPVTFSDGVTLSFTVGAVYERSDIVGEVLLPRAAWAPHAVQDLDRLVLVELEPGVRGEAGRVAVEAATEAHGRPSVLTGPDFAATTTSFVDTALGMVYVMLALAVVIALLGIGNTLSLSVHERAREIGLLRAVGATRPQVRSLVRWEAVTTALFGTVGGLAAGGLCAWAVIRADSASGFVTTLSIPAARLAGVLAVGAVAGVLAAARPARRAARAPVLATLR